MRAALVLAVLFLIGCPHVRATPLPQPHANVIPQHTVVPTPMSVPATWVTVHTEKEFWHIFDINAITIVLIETSSCKDCKEIKQEVTGKKVRPDVRFIDWKIPGKLLTHGAANGAIVWTMGIDMHHTSSLKPFAAIISEKTVHQAHSMTIEATCLGANACRNALASWLEGLCPLCPRL